MTDEASKLKGLLWMGGALCLGVGLALGLSPLIRTIPWQWEEKLSSYVGAGSSGTLCLGNPNTDILLKKLVGRLYPLEPNDDKFSIHVEIVNNPVVNAYATLGGHIYINAGLLQRAESAEEVAGVLGHEMEHVKRRHILDNVMTRLLTTGGLHIILSGQPDPRWLTYFLNMSFTRTQESEADAGSLRRLQLAHIDNQGFKDFFRRMDEASYGSSFLSDHPDNQDRYEMANTFENDHPTPIMTDKDWQTFKSYCRTPHS